MPAADAPRDLVGMWLLSDGLREANESRRRGRRRIIILGGSHSAYAVARRARITGASRSAAARSTSFSAARRGSSILIARPRCDDLYHVAPGDICPRTLRVNRMGGLRGHGREMWRQIACRPGTLPEPRIATMPSNTSLAPSCARSSNEAALATPALATGRRPCRCSMPSGQRLAFQAERGAMRSARIAGCCSPTAPGCPISGIGLGTGFKYPQAWAASRISTARPTA